MGGLVDTYPTTIFSDRSCWRQKLSDTEASYWMKKSQEVTHKVFFASDPGLDEGCVLEIDGDVLDVVSVSNPDASVGLGYLWRVNCNQQR